MKRGLLGIFGFLILLLIFSGCTETGGVVKTRGVTQQGGVVQQTCSDQDNDTICDNNDNCLLIANNNQINTDIKYDNYGNICDPDFDDNEVVGISDLAALRQIFGATLNSTNYNATIDLDSNGAIGISDLGILRSYYGLPPGPTGIIQQTTTTSTSTTLVSNQTCLDTDGGNNIYFRSDCSVYFSSNNTRSNLTDYCSTSTILGEYTCDLNNRCQANLINCPSGYICSNGACIFSTTTTTLVSNQTNSS